MNKVSLFTYISAFSAVSAFASPSDADFYKYTNYNPDAPESALNFADFVNPTGKSRPQTWWHWIGQNVSREGIDADLKAMAENGYGAAIIFNISSNSSGRMKSRTKEGSLVFNSPEWFDTFKYVVEKGKEYGVDIGIHNCDGWSEAGGPWVKPEHSMRKLVHTIKKVEGNGSEQTFTLAEPWGYPKYKDTYRDIAVVAYPNLRPEKAEMLKTLVSISSAGGDTKDFTPIKNWNGEEFKVSATSRNYKKFGFIMEFSEPYESDGIAIRKPISWYMPVPLELEVSDDKKTWHKVSDIKFKTGNMLIRYPVAKGKYWRIIRKLLNSNKDMKAENLRIISLDLLKVGVMPAKMPLIQAQLEKVNVLPHRSTTYTPLPYDDMEVPENAIIALKDIHIFRNAVSADGKFTWKVPEGKWCIMRIGHTTNSRGVHPATSGGKGLEIDKMSKKAVDMHFDSYIKKMIDTAGENAGKVFKYVETDSWECGNQNWTDGLDKIFRKENGYDMFRFAPTFAGECVESKKATEAFGADFRKTTSKLVMENFYGRLGERIREAGLLYESEPASEAFMNDPIYGFKVSDIPQHEIWQGARRLNGVNGVSFSSSANGRWCNVPSTAHFFGKEITTCESLSQGDGNWTDAPYVLKGTSDTIVLSGYNTMVFHSYTHQPDERVPGWQMEPWGSTINRKMPWWSLSRPFFDYLSRIQYMTQKGKASSRILNFVSDQVPVENGVIDVPEGVEIDIINGDGVRNYIRIEDGKIVSPGRMAYDLLAINKDRFLRIDTMQKLKKYVSEGAVISGYFYDGRYLTRVGGSDAERVWKRLNKQLFGGKEKAIIKIGKGKVYANYSLKEAAEAMGMKPAFFAYSKIGKVNPRSLLHIKRIHKNGDVWYWVLNNKDTEVRVNAYFDVVGKSAEIWCPESGKRYTPAAVSEKDGYTSLPLTLPEHTNAFVVFKNVKNNANVVKYTINGKERFPNISKDLAVSDMDSISNDFTIGLNVSPKAKLDNYKEKASGIINFSNEVNALNAEGKHMHLGNAHTGIGIIAGTNGVAVIEHGAGYRSAVLTHYTPIAEDTNIAVVYKDKVPTLYINGKVVKTGLKSPRTPHPSNKLGGFSGIVKDLKIRSESLDASEIMAFQQESSKTMRQIANVEPKLMLDSNGKIVAEFFVAGKLNATLADGTEVALESKGIKPVKILPPYKVEFEEKYGGVKSTNFSKLVSWTEHSDPRISNYSGIATYTMYANVPAEKFGKNIKAYLDFEKITDVGKVWINGKLAGSMWKPPYRLEITELLKVGKNKIEVKVGNTWANRALYDATLPPEKRITWGNTMWFHYPVAGEKESKGTWLKGKIPSGIMDETPLILFSETK